MKKLLALFLALMLLLSLAACTDGGVETIVGKWSGKIDLSSVMEMSSVAETLGTDVSIPALQVILEVKEDGTLTFCADPAKLEDWVDAMVDVAIELSAAQIGGMEALQSMLELSGMTMDDFRAEVANGLGASDMADGFAEDGYYKYEEGKLYVAGEKEDLDAGKPNSTWHVKLSGNTLTVTDIEQNGELASAEMAGMFPLVMKK